AARGLQARRLQLVYDVSLRFAESLTSGFATFKAVVREKLDMGPPSVAVKNFRWLLRNCKSDAAAENSEGSNHGPERFHLSGVQRRIEAEQDSSCGATSKRYTLEFESQFFAPNSRIDRCCSAT